MTVKGPPTDARDARSSDQRQTFGHSFDQDLNTSRPYTRAMQNHRAWSTTSSEIHTMGWSRLSDLSLAEVSHVSVIKLPFCSQELWNGQRYFDKGIDRGGLLASYRSPLRSDETRAPTSRPRLNIRAPLYPGQMIETLSPIREDKAVPVAARTMSLIDSFRLRLTKGSYRDSRVVNDNHFLGISSSGKTTTYNDL